MRAFLLTYSQQCPDWQAQAIMNQTNAVKTWVQPFPSAVIVVSDLDVTDLGAVLQSRFGGTWFLITEIAANTVQGFLPGNLWQFIAGAPSAPNPSLSQYLPNPTGTATRIAS